MHRSSEEDRRVGHGFPVAPMDYMPMRDKDKGHTGEDEGQENGMPILVMTDREKGMARSSVVLRKGVYACEAIP